MTRGPLELVDLIAGILDRIGVDYALGGSLASSLFGEPRSTIDVDIAVRLDLSHATLLIESLGPEFYVPTAAVHEAAAQHGSCNLVDTSSGIKIDLFVTGDGDLDAMQMDRRVAVTIPGLDRSIWVTAPEVQVLRKLDWYRSGGSVSERQLRDVASILRVTELDHAFLDGAAERLGLVALLGEARARAAQR